MSKSNTYKTLEEIAAKSGGDYKGPVRKQIEVLQEIAENIGEGGTPSEPVTPARVKQLYESNPDTNAFTDTDKQNIAELMEEPSFSGSYNDLTDKPVIPSMDALSPVAFSGQFQDLVNTPEYVLASSKGQASGVTPLDSAGLVPLEHLNVSGLTFKGSWNAETNTPALIDGTGNTGDFYKCGVAGTYNFGNGNFTFLVGDWVMFAAGTWQRLGSSESVASVNGRLGAVVLTAADVGALPASYVPPAAEVLSVNTKKGAVVLSAADVGALPSTYIPTYASLTGKPDLTQYQPKQRGAIGPAIPAALLRKNANQGIPTGVDTALTWQVAEYDQFAMLKNGNELVIPAWAKYVQIETCIQWGGNSGSNANPMNLYIWKNGISVPGMPYSRMFGNVNVMTQAISSGIVKVVGGDVLTLMAGHTTAANRNIEPGPNNARTWVSVKLYE